MKDIMKKTNWVIVVLCIVLVCAACSKQAEINADTNTENSPNATDTNSTTVDTFTILDTESDSGRTVDTETITDTDVLQCIEIHGECECDGDCAGGGLIKIWYEDSIKNPTFVEANEFGLFRYGCSNCEPCGTFFATKSKDNDEWIETTIVNFCTNMVLYNSECSDCLVVIEHNAI